MNTHNIAPLPPEAQALLNDLKGIVEPEAIGWWPLAWGWWVLIVLSLCLLGLSVYYIAHRLRKRRYRKVALSLLAQYSEQTHTDEHFATAIFSLTKRVALHAYPHLKTHIARTFGRDWLRFLDEHCLNSEFDKRFGNTLGTSLYQQCAVDQTAVIEHTQHWIRKHSERRLLKTSTTIEQKAKQHA